MGLQVVSSMAEHRSRETVAILKCALERARNGELEGAMLCLKPIDGPEEAYFTGAYRSDGPALSLIGRMWDRLIHRNGHPMAVRR